MAEPAVNTTKSVTQPKQKTNAELAAETKAALVKLKSAKEVKVSIPTALQAQLGSVYPIGINGIFVRVAVNGEDHSIPEPHANLLKQVLKDLK